MKKIFIASTNKGKISEIRSYLAPMGYELFSLLDNPGIPDIEETGLTFEENALIKAKAVFDVVKIPVLADDSGLEVDLLGGRPGVYSARYSGEGATDEKNVTKLLNELGDNVKNRTARFRCVIALYDGMNERFFDGVCEGNITFHPKGKDGFGYDPVFMPIGYQQTFSELGVDVKNTISHRGKALLSLVKFLELENTM
ncbi:MAG: XTP/dITP diphosphatase [Ignavibacteria bacterium]|nr:XTP/dITP diphosphatase [Ignavibacteria bacterium]